MPKISVIICTYGRALVLAQALQSLVGQSFRDFEVLLVDGNGPESGFKKLIQEFDSRLELRWLRTPRGLTRQRNAGLQAAVGEILCFLDDDVSFGPDFLARVCAVFESAEMAGVGGVTGYDVLNYPTCITLRWRLRRLLGVVPSLKPGDADHLGRAVPVSFLEPFSGCRKVGWLAGFCMIYRRAAVEGLEFDEGLPTYGGEDRDFSTRVGKNWQLMMDGDLHILHHYCDQGRASDLERMRQTGFGTGRRFAKSAQSIADYCHVFLTLMGDFVLDVIHFAGQPSSIRFALIFARLTGSLSGFRSWRGAAEQTR
jgi:glycosyltransferase involved in cell wall biosynthesis